MAVQSGAEPHWCRSAPTLGLLSDFEALVMFAGAQRKRRAAPRQRRQPAAPEEEEEDAEGPFNPENPYQVSHTAQTRVFSPVVVAVAPPPVRSHLRDT